MWIVLVEDYRGAVNDDVGVVDTACSRVCPSALCLETLGRARRGKVAVRFSVAASVRLPGAGDGVGVGDVARVSALAMAESG